MSRFSRSFCRHRIYQPVSPALIIISLLILSACQTRDVDDFAEGPLALSPAPTLVYAGSCDQTPTMEGWLQVVIFQRRDFVGLMSESPGQSRVDLREDVEQMAAYRDRIAQEPVPDCGLDLIPALVAAMDGVLAEFLNYINGEDVDLGVVVESYNDEFAAVDAQLDALLVRLDNQFQTPTGP
jgi:hypothetical protein